MNLWFLYKKILLVSTCVLSCKYDHNFNNCTINNSWNKAWRHWCKGSSEMRFFHPSAPFCKNVERLFSIETCSTMQQSLVSASTFSQFSEEASGYDCIDLDFTGTTFKVTNNYFLVNWHRDIPFNTKVVQPSTPLVQKIVTSRKRKWWHQTNILEPIQNSNSLINESLFAIESDSGKNLHSSDVLCIGT